MLFGGVASAEGEEVAVGSSELDEEAVWLAQLVIVHNDVGVAIAVLPTRVARRPKVIATVSPAREAIFRSDPEMPTERFIQICWAGLDKEVFTFDDTMYRPWDALDGLACIRTHAISTSSTTGIDSSLTFLSHL